MLQPGAVYRMSSDGTLVRLANEQRRSPRHELSYRAEMFELDSNISFQVTISEAGLFGCYIHSSRWLSRRLESRLRMTCDGAAFTVRGRVVSPETATGFGIEFVGVGSDEKAMWGRLAVDDITKPPGLRSPTRMIVLRRETEK